MADNDFKEITDIYNCIKNYDQKLKTVPSKNVLFLGETGKGKSTLTEFLSGNPDLQVEGNPGAYVIVDKTDSISNPKDTILSKTVMPRPVPLREAENETYYLDCPGFRDTRSFTMDISCTICMKRTLRNCHLAKVVFVLSYEDVKTGGQRNGFLDLVQQAGGFISNFDKFEDSIALFVTKVPVFTEEVNGVRQVVADEILKKNIIEYLLNVKETIIKSNEENSTPKEKRATYENALKLISLLIGGNKGNSHIGIFLCPDTKGPLQQIKTMQQSRVAMNAIINNVLKYTEINENDFGYSLSWESKSCIAKQIPDIIKKTSHIIEEIVKEFIQFYQELEKNSTNIEELADVFSEEHVLWKNALAALGKLKITVDALTCILDYIQKVLGRIKSQCCISDDIMDKINQKTSELKDHIELISTLEELTSQRFQQSIADLLKLFQNATEYLDTTKAWYEKFPHIFERLSKCRVSKQNIHDKFARLENLLQKRANMDKIDSSAINASFTKLFDEDSSLPIAHVNSVKVEHLRRLCNIIFEEHATDLEENTIRFTGNFINLSLATAPRDFKVSKLKIFAAYKVIIDCDFKRIGNNFQLTIVAPEWEIVGGKRKIVLDGQPGSDNETVAKNGSKPGNKGENGVAGLPGGNGGHFIGIGFKIINYGGLEISACGGIGGKGQKGGNGGDGNNGVAAAKPDDKGIWFWEGDLEPKCDSIESKTTSSSWIPFLFRAKDICECVINGKDGGRGHDGGDGGMGGIGGHPGSVSLKGFATSYQPIIKVEQGKVGEGGEGGLGGKGGLHGDTLRFTAEVDNPVLDLSYWKKNLTHSNVRRVERGRADNGAPGKKGASKLDLMMPEKFVNVNNELDILHEYIEWLSNAIHLHPLQKRSIKFLKNLEALKKTRK